MELISRCFLDLLGCAAAQPSSSHPSVLLSNPVSLMRSKGSVLEAAVFGFEPYSQYSLRVEAVNGAGRVNLIASHSFHSTPPASLRCFVIVQAVCPVRG